MLHSRSAVMRSPICIAARCVQDPDAKKPDDWDERPKIDDPKSVKPNGWDNIPKTMVDKDAKKPDDWDDEEDGAWEAPQIPNPEYKGEWEPDQIDNPDFKVCNAGGMCLWNSKRECRSCAMQASCSQRMVTHGTTQPALHDCC